MISIDGVYPLTKEDAVNFVVNAKSSADIFRAMLMTLPENEITKIMCNLGFDAIRVIGPVLRMY